VDLLDTATLSDWASDCKSSKGSTWLGGLLYLKTEAKLASEILHYIESFMMDEVQRKDGHFSKSYTNVTAL